ncbi:MAG TPA: energy transducer TonB [Opitutaceae bacterium]
MKSHPTRLLIAAVLIAALGSLRAEESQVPAQSGLHGSLIGFVEPTYPFALRFRGVTSGFAMVWLTVDPSGSLLDAYATEFSHARFADSSLDAIRQWRFAPDDSGSTLPRLFSVRFNFSLGGMVVVEVHASDDLEQSNPFPLARPVFASYSFEDLDQIPDALHSPLPAYPEALKAEMKSGKVEILFHVDKSGRVRVPLVTHSDDPLFAEAAMAAITKWSFSAPKRNGRTASAFALQRFTFGPRTASNG